MTTSNPSLFAEEMALPHRIGPAEVSRSSIQSLLTKGRGSTSAFDFTLNAYRGCTFGCAYCYAPSFESRERLAERWGSWVEVKDSAISMLTGVDLKNKTIFMSSVTDPYQPLEAKIRLTRDIVRTLSQKGALLVVQTRSPLVTRDIDLLRGFESVKVNVSIPTESDEIRKRYEPGAPSIEARLRAVRRLSDEGILVSICISPMLPLLNPLRFAEMINDSGAQRVTATWFHRSDKPFTATTRSLAVSINRTQEWDRSRFEQVCEVLKETCPAYTSGARAFGPEF